MDIQTDKLWPYKKSLAFIVMPLTWLFFTVVFIAGERFGVLQSEMAGSSSVIIIAVISFIPLSLVLLDFFAEKGAKINIKGVEIDFGRIDLEKSNIKRDSFGLPDNIGLLGPIISDTAPMNIIETLEIATHHDVVILNIKNGNAWWVTRLLALCAGAVRTGSPQIFVFTGKKENILDFFLGWAKPKDILHAILNDNDQYKIRYERAVKIARQVVLYNDPLLIPPGMVLPVDVIRYTTNPTYQALDEAVTEQIIMDQMASQYAYGITGSLETQPDKLNLTRLETLFGPYLYKQTIELTAPNEVQIEQLLKARQQYIPLVKGGRYDSILQRADGEQLFLKELFEQSRKK